MAIPSASTTGQEALYTVSYRSGGFHSRQPLYYASGHFPRGFTNTPYPSNTEDGRFFSVEWKTRTNFFVKL
jgi:hypothetical protein